MGNLYREIREHLGVSQAAITENIVNQSVVSRFEKEGEIPNVLVLNTLFQRLGKSLSHFTVLVTQEEYDYLTWRRDVLNKIFRGCCELSNFECEMANDRHIHRKLQKQFTDFWKAYLANDYEGMEKAILLTVTRFPNNLDLEKCYSAEECIYMLLFLEKSILAPKFQEEQN